MPYKSSQKILPPLPKSFVLKKSRILSELSIPESSYADKSPKGSVDVQIRDLIAEINSVDGLVTTSSCAGRVAVFVEGVKEFKDVGGRDSALEDENDVQPRVEFVNDDEDEVSTQEQGRMDMIQPDINSTSKSTSKKKIKTGPGGKGAGGRWLYVSHDPVILRQGSEDASVSSKYFTELFGLSTRSPQHMSTLQSSNFKDNDNGKLVSSRPRTNLRVIRLSFSPLILHVLCASLHHARPLLSAAINAGFRESGVQSLKGLEDPDTGTMVAIRTAGVGFETVIGVVEKSITTAENGDVEEAEIMMGCVSEEYLEMCIGIVNERFRANDDRREAFISEFRNAMSRAGIISRSNNLRDLSSTCGSIPDDDNNQDANTLRPWEDKDERRRRKRSEGLRRKADAKHNINQGRGTGVDDLDESLEASMFLLADESVIDPR